MRLLTVTDSDIIEAIGFSIDGPQVNGGTFGTLGIVFKSSADVVYEYKDVAAETFVKLVSGESVGKSFHEFFRKSKYPFTKSARPDLKK